MKRTKRISIQVATTAALSLLLAFSVPTIVDRRDYAAAVSQMVKNPSPENEAVLQREAAKNRHEVFVADAYAVGILFLLLNAGWIFVSRVSSRYKSRVLAQK